VKIGWIGHKATPTIIGHTTNIQQGISTGCEAVLVEDVMQATPNDILTLNTSDAVKVLSLRKDLREEFDAEFNIEKTTPHNYLYSFFNGEEFSDFIEIDYSMRFMSCNAGPALGFVQGCALSCDITLYEAFPTLRKLQKALAAMEYRGEITIGITKGFRVCDIRFGHFTGGFSLYSELCQKSIQNAYSFAAGEGASCEVFDNSVALCTLLSLPPFPTELKVTTYIDAPPPAEKHLYRYFYTVEQQVAFAAAWGLNIKEARSRVYKIINTCRQYNADIQYRADVGRRFRFTFNQERGEELLR
jgi:hypothetical protein